MSGKAILTRVSLILPILVVVFVSGCVQQDTGITFGDGVVIQGWQPDFSSVEAGEPVKFFLKIQNQGEVDAENVESNIIGIDPDKWGLSVGEHDFGTVVAPDSATNTPGEVKTHYYTGMTAPDMPAGTSFTFEPIVRVSYDYKTIAQKPITVVDVEELRRLIQQGRSIESKDTVYTSGPLSVEIRTGNFVKTQEVDDPFPVYIVVTNDLWESGGSVIRGGGFSAPSDFDYPIQLKVDMPSGGGTVTGDKCTSTGSWIDLWQGKTAEITCQIEVDPADPGTRVERLISVELDYRYQVDSTTAVTVTGN
jgi:hypothetical protein